VNIEDIDIIGLELGQRSFKRVLERFLVVPGIVDLNTGEFTFFLVDEGSGVFTVCQSKSLGRTCVARTISSRFFRFSIQSPMMTSDCSSANQLDP
jgi:hypothetical protein